MKLARLCACVMLVLLAGAFCAPAAHAQEIDVTASASGEVPSGRVFTEVTATIEAPAEPSERPASSSDASAEDKSPIPTTGDNTIAALVFVVLALTCFVAAQALQRRT